MQRFYSFVIFCVIHCFLKYVKVLLFMMWIYSFGAGLLLCLDKLFHSEAKASFPAHQISWVSEYVIFLRGLAQQRRSAQKRNLAQR